MPEPANITRPMTPIKGVVRCQCRECGTVTVQDFTLNMAPQQQQPAWQSERPPPKHTPRQEMTPERAANFVLPIGKYRGRTLDDVYKLQPTYVEWLARTMDRAIGRAAQGYLRMCKHPDRN